MSTSTPVNQATDNDFSPLPPPSGGAEKADYYISQITELVSSDKLIVAHTDLSKFDPTSLQDHYRIDLKDFEVEVSHNKKPDTGEDFYVILFNNLKRINEKCAEKAILAYMNLTDGQFQKFKVVAQEQIERKRKEEEEKRFKEAMAPIDSVLENLSASNTSSGNEDRKTDIPDPFIASA